MMVSADIYFYKADTLQKGLENHSMIYKLMVSADTCKREKLHFSAFTQMHGHVMVYSTAGGSSLGKGSYQSWAIAVSL